MEVSGVQKLARVLRVLVLITFVCNLIALFVVPCMAVLTPRGAAADLVEELTYLLNRETWPADRWPLSAVFVGSWILTWASPYTAVLTLFLWACGICTAVILWQAKRVLDTILTGETFTFGNAANLKRAAVCCFVISGAALTRTIWGLFFYRGIAALLTYNFLFVPLFLLAGLVCMVMSALFRQAAELKAENDLTI